MATSLYLRTGPREDVAASLNHCARCMVWVRTDPHEWKWVLLAAWCALQSSLIAVLRGSGGTGIRAAQNEEKLVSWLSSPNLDPCAYPHPFLASVPELIKRATTDRQPILSLSHEQRRAIDRLHDELRNDFMHIKDNSWSIELAGLPAIILEVLGVLEQLVCGEMFQLHVDDDQRAEIALAIEQVRGSARALQLHGAP